MTLPNITANPYIVGVVMSSAMALIMNIKQLPIKGFKHLTGWFRKKMVYTVKIYQYDELFFLLEAWLYKNHERQYREVEASLEWSNTTDPICQSSSVVREGAAEQLTKRQVFYKQEDNIFFINYGGKRIMIEKTSSKQEKSISLKDMYFRSYILTGYKCKEQINSFLDIILQEYDASRPKSMVKVFVSTSYGEWRMFDDLRVKSLDRVFLRDQTRSALEKDVEVFTNSEDWYSGVGIPYKRGYCFYGMPGNGKTTLALALSRHLHRNVHILNLNALDNDDSLQRCFSELRKDSALLIEDIDRSFVQRDNKDSKISFSVFLNVLDGALTKHGLIVIITTNHIEHLDPALLRDGRIDVKLEIPNPDNRQISDYLSLFYQTPIQIDGRENDSLCMASVQEICVRNKDSFHKAACEITYRIKDVMEER